MSITTTDEIRYALKYRGFVNIGDGAIVGDSVNLADIEKKEIRITSKGGQVTYNGPPGKFPFEWNWKSSYVHTPAKLNISDFEMTTMSGKDAGFLKISGDKPPLSTTVKRSRIFASSSWAIDANGVGDCNSIFFEDIQSYGAGAIRWRCNNANGVKWGWLDSWRHFGSSRPGASFMFENCQNILRDNLVDDGTPTLLSELNGVYAGPICVYDLNCSGHNRYYDLWFEPWGTWSVDAPGCWGVTIQVDEESGNHQIHHNQINNISMNATGLEVSTRLFHFMGGGSSNDAGHLRVNFEDQFNLRDGDTLFGGKCYNVAVRPVASGFWNAVDLASFNDYNADSFRDRWAYTSFSHPFQVYDDRVSYTSSGYAATYTAEPVQPEDA